MAVAVLLAEPCKCGVLTVECVEKEWGDDVARLIRGLVKVSGFTAIMLPLLIPKTSAACFSLLLKIYAS